MPQKLIEGNVSESRALKGYKKPGGVVKDVYDIIFDGLHFYILYIID